MVRPDRQKFTAGVVMVLIGLGFYLVQRFETVDSTENKGRPRDERDARKTQPDRQKVAPSKLFTDQDLPEPD